MNQTTANIELAYSSQQPAEHEPTWAATIPRWSQLDPVSAAIAEAWHHWQATGALAPDFTPTTFVLASHQGSNRSDLAFARSGAFSPARFVSTLPSVSLSALLQATGWTGPMYCVQNGAMTLATAISEAKLLAGQGKGPVCIISYETQADPQASVCQVEVRAAIFV